MLPLEVNLSFAATSRSAFYAMDEAMKDFKHKIAGLPIKHLDRNKELSWKDGWWNRSGMSTNQNHS